MIFFHLHDIPRYNNSKISSSPVRFFSFPFFFSEKSYDKSSRFYPLPSVPELFTPRSVIRNTYLEWIEVKRPRRNERSVFPFQLFLLRFKIIPPHNWRPHVRYVRWLGTDTRRRGKASWWKKVEFPYRSFTFFSVDLRPCSCAVQQRSTRVGEQKTLYSLNRGQTSHFNWDVSIARCKTSVLRREYLRPTKIEANKQVPYPLLPALRFSIYALSTRISSKILPFVVHAPFFLRARPLEM